MNREINYIGSEATFEATRKNSENNGYVVNSIEYDGSDAFTVSDAETGVTIDINVFAPEMRGKVAQKNWYD